MRVVGDGAQRYADARKIEEKGERGDENAGGGGGDEIKLADLNWPEFDGHVKDAEIELMHLAPISICAAPSMTKLSPSVAMNSVICG